MPIKTVGFTSISSIRTVPAQTIFPARYKFHMRRINTPTISAEMIYCHPLLYRTAKYHVCNPVGILNFSSIIKLSVSSPADVAKPSPTCSITIWLDSCKKTRLPRHALFNSLKATLRFSNWLISRPRSAGVATIFFPFHSGPSKSRFSCFRSCGPSMW